jgi:HSP20 family protein
MLMRADPFRAWDRFFDQVGAPVAAPMDAYRVGDVITAEFDLPGVDPGSINVQIERGELRVSAERRPHLPDGAQMLVRERLETTVQRRLMLGEALDVEHVDAEYRDGVLTLRIPLSEAAKPRRVDVRHGSDAQPAIEVGSTQAPVTQGH